MRISHCHCTSSNTETNYRQMTHLKCLLLTKALHVSCPFHTNAAPVLALCLHSSGSEPFFIFSPRFVHTAQSPSGAASLRHRLRHDVYFSGNADTAFQLYVMLQTKSLLLHRLLFSSHIQHRRNSVQTSKRSARSGIAGYYFYHS